MGTAFFVDHFCLAFQSFLKPFKDRYRLCSYRAVMNMGITILIGIGAKDSDLLEGVFLKGKHPVVFQKHQALLRCPQGNFIVFLAINKKICSFKIGLIRLIEKAYEEFNAENITYPLVNRIHTYSAFIHQLPERKHVAIRASECAAHIESSLDTLADRLFHCAGDMVLAMKIFHRI